jgi:hypothetical protein
MPSLEERVDFASGDDADKYKYVTEALGVRYKARFRHKTEGWRGIVWYAHQPEIPGFDGIECHVFREHDGMHDVVLLAKLAFEAA